MLFRHLIIICFFDEDIKINKNNVFHLVDVDFIIHHSDFFIAFNIFDFMNNNFNVICIGY